MRKLNDIIYEALEAKRGRTDMEPWITDGEYDAAQRWREEHDGTLLGRLHEIVSEIKLGMDCTIRIGQDTTYFDAEGKPAGRLFVQIECYRRDVITGEMGFGRGGKFWVGEHMTRNEIVQGIFGLYMAYWTHEARENFSWRGRRVFGPHIDTEALWEAAVHVDVRSAKHVEDQDTAELAQEQS